MGPIPDNGNGKGQTGSVGYPMKNARGRLSGIVSVCLLTLLWLMVPTAVRAEALWRTQTVTVVYPQSLKPAARTVVSAFPRMRGELEAAFGWKVDFVPTVRLFGRGSAFERRVGTDQLAALAITDKNLILIDLAKVQTRPRGLENTLKHELCHLLLHRRIPGENLPRWLDEGIAQWMSDGVSEILGGRKSDLLSRAVLAGDTLYFHNINYGFHQRGQSLRLSYAASRDIVQYIHDQFGEKKLFSLLAALQQGESFPDAVYQSLSVSLQALETGWHGHLRDKTTWLMYIAAHITPILFSLGAVLLVVGFVRHRIRKKKQYARLAAEEEEGHGPWES